MSEIISSFQNYLVGILKIFAQKLALYLFFMGRNFFVQLFCASF